MLLSGDDIKRPYALRFVSKLLLKEKIADKLPEWVRYPMPIAQKVIKYHFLNAELISQKYKQDPVFINLIHVHTRKKFHLKFRVKTNQIFLFFMLRGAFEFRTVDGRHITNARANQFYICNVRPGIFDASMNPGDHVALVISVTLEWVSKVCNELANINPVLSATFEPKQLYKTLPSCRIDKKVHQWLKEVYAAPKENYGVVEATLWRSISLTLIHYNNLLKIRQDNLANKIKTYLDENYTDPEIDSHSLSELYFVTERTLRNQFKLEFDETIYHYYSRLRLEKAKYLIEEKKKPVKDVYIMVGYNDESAFRYAYNKYTAENPL